MRLRVREEEKRSDGKGSHEAMGPGRREAVRCEKKSCDYGFGKKKSGPMGKESESPWCWKEDKWPDGKGSREVKGPERNKHHHKEEKWVVMGTH
ncbi:hypothetical protein [Heyndrickxia vini]|uniref:Uncharacterized protein n=1 Tax=Heyndrickxia vini TaxID=1476025 RepID=A0ABX7DY21_9BACI|nr:hypothetical protein [Heyndrickxia vini]QQZ08226.1 hypothetical protein I5776_14235 [Heyndrickxia vini]